MSLLVKSRPYCSRSHNLVKRFPVFTNEQRYKAVEELKKRVSENTDCFGYQIEAFITNLSLEVKIPDNDRITLMKACSRDVLDFFPEQQKRLTLNAYDAAKKVEPLERRNVIFHNVSLNAFLFQDVDFNTEKFLSDMKEINVRPNSSIMEKILGYYCNRQDIDRALDVMLADDNGIVINEFVASYLIYCHCSRGEYGEAEKIVNLLDERKIKYGDRVLTNFVLGAAFHGDFDRLTQYMDNYQPDDAAMLDALVLAAGSGHEKVILDKLPVQDIEKLTRNSRRTIKQLVELDEIGLAEQLLLKTEELKENSSNKEQCISISPSVIVMSQMLPNMTDPIQAVSKIREYQPVDSKIVSRSVLLLVDMAFNTPEKKSFCAATIKTIKSENLGLATLKRIDDLVSQNVAERLRGAKTDNEVLFILKNISDLGLRMLSKKEWMSCMFQLIPRDVEYTNQRELLNKVFETRGYLDEIAQMYKGSYSTTVIWSFMIKHLLMGTAKNELFFSAAAEIVTLIGVPYGPQRWYDYLGFGLLHTKDVKSYIKILKVANANCPKRGDGEDYKQILGSLLVTINVAKKNNEDIDDLLEQVFEQIWAAKLLLSPGIREKLCGSISNPILSAVAKNLPVFEATDYRNITPESKNSKKLKKKRVLLREQEQNFTEMIDK